MHDNDLVLILYVLSCVFFVCCLHFPYFVLASLFLMLLFVVFWFCSWPEDVPFFVGEGIVMA